MTVTERDKRELFERAEQVLGADGANILMDLLPPAGWADVATKQDLRELEARMDTMEQRIIATLRKDMNALMLKCFGLFVALVLGLVPALVVPLVTLR
jgi:hypothetical protein